MPLREKAILHRLRRVPLYLQIVVALALGVIVGIFLTPERAVGFDIPARLILRLLGAIAPPLILVAVMRAKGGGSEMRYARLLDGHRRLRRSLESLARSSSTTLASSVF